MQAEPGSQRVKGPPEEKLRLGMGLGPASKVAPALSTAPRIHSQSLGLVTVEALVVAPAAGQ